MSKNDIRSYIVLAIILVVFSVIAFAAPFSMTAPFWIAYVFGVIAIAFQVYVFQISFSNGKDVKSKFYGFPIARIGVIYMCVQLVLSLIEMATAAVIPTWVVVIIDIIPVTVALIGCIAADAMREEIERQDVQLKKDVNNMRALQSMSAALVGQCSDSILKKELQDLAYEFKYSDPVSSEATMMIENELSVLTKELQRAVIEGDPIGASAFCKRIISSLAERNRLCAMNK